MQQKTFQSSESIAAALRQAGHEKVYCQTYENGSHAGVVLQNPESQELMHAFWKAHNRPHNPALAEKGTDAFERLQKKSISKIG